MYLILLPHVSREWIIEELNRHRPLLGECLSSFASCFPIAFFEPEFNGNNKRASNVSQLSPEANGEYFFFLLNIHKTQTR